MATTLVLGEDVHLSLELSVGLDRAGLGENHAALDVFFLGAAEQHADVVAGLGAVQQLAEHFDVRRRGLAGVLEADDLDFGHLVDDAALHTTGHDCAATFNVEHVFDAHQEGLVLLARGLRDKGIQGVEQVGDGGFAFRSSGNGGGG